MTDMTAVIVPKSDQINADDLIAGPMTITITDVKVVGGQEQPVSIHFAGSGKVYRPCKSMSRVLVAAWGADANAYKGRSFTLYRDPNVKWGGMAVGGIRISEMTDIKQDMTLMLTMTKANRAPHKIKRLVVVADPAQDEARTEAAKGKAAFTDWYRRNAAKREAIAPIMAELKKACDDADAAMTAQEVEEPFGLPPITNPPTDAEIEAQIRAELAPRDAQLEGRN